MDMGVPARDRREVLYIREAECGCVTTGNNRRTCCRKDLPNRQKKHTTRTCLRACRASHRPAHPSDFPFNCPCCPYFAKTQADVEEEDAGTKTAAQEKTHFKDHEGQGHKFRPSPPTGHGNILNCRYDEPCTPMHFGFAFSCCSDHECFSRSKIRPIFRPQNLTAGWNNKGSILRHRAVVYGRIFSK
jgi:hypothetical protein